MKYCLTAIFACLLFSCTKTDETSSAGGGTTPPPSGGGGITLGVQKDIFGSTRHTYAGRLEANDNRMFFATYNTSTSTNEFYAGDQKDSSYQLTPYGNMYSFTVQTAKTALKPNGDIVCILKVANPSGPDSILTLINKPATNYWQVVKRELISAFWNNYYYSFELFIESTSTGRLVLTGHTKAAVSDDNGLTWRETFSLPAGYLNHTDRHSSYTSGSRNFIISGNVLLYSDNNFETATLVTVGPFGNIENKPVKLDDQRLVLQYDMPSRNIYQSVNNGQSWTLMPLYDPVDTLSQFSGSYFCFLGGNTIRTRATYKPCNSFYTVDIDPAKHFAFYPVTRPPCLSSSDDPYLKSCQRADKRMYYAIASSIGSLSYFGIKRDY